jgi:hypothetical protein
MIHDYWDVTVIMMMQAESEDSARGPAANLKLRPAGEMLKL